MKKENKSESVVVEEKALPGAITPEQEEAFKKAMENFTKVIDSYSTNRKSRRQFKKLYGEMPPPKYFPYVKESEDK